MSLAKIAISKVLSNVMLLEGKIRWSGKSNYVILPNGMKMFFEQEDKSNVYGYVKTVWDYNVYGDVEQGCVLIDAGASIGTYSLKECQRAKTVIAFEPVGRIWQQLMNNLLLNKVFNVIPVKLALGEKSGTGTVFLTRQLMGYGHEMRPRHSPYKELKVNVVTLDEIIETNGNQNIEIKADIEGLEPEMLRGARNLLERGNITRLALAVYHYKNEENECRAILENYGYRMSSKLFFDGDIILQARLKR